VGRVGLEPTTQCISVGKRWCMLCIVCLLWAQKVFRSVPHFATVQCVTLFFYERPNSPWVWVQYSLTPGNRHREKTPVRKDEARKQQKLARHRAALEERLLAEKEAGDSGPLTQGGWKWVLPWINVRHQGRTAQVYRAQWRVISSFLHERKIHSPLHLEREHCYAYVTWRKESRRGRFNLKIKTNTSIGELKLLAQVMDEARKRRLAIGDNPARKLGIEKETTIPKREMTDAEIRQIDSALQQRPLWMRRSFEMALYTGLRFAETRIARHQVDWPRNVIDIDEPKGGRKRAFSIPIYDTVRPLLENWWKTGELHLWQLPEGENPTLTGLRWSKFFREIKLPHLCFHCTRVTFISRGARAGISEGMMMKLVNHASAEVHRIYQRLPPGDAAKLVSAIPIPRVGAAR
jgi:hypothetical protein